MHVPRVKNEIHHTEKAIIKEIPVIRHRYKENIVGAAHVYRDNDDLHGNNYNEYKNYNNEDEDDDTTGFAATTRGFHHRNLYPIDDDVVGQQSTAAAAAATYSSYSHLLRERQLERNKHYRDRLPFTTTSDGGDDDDNDDNDYQYARAWSIITGHPTAEVVASAKGGKNVSALYGIAKNYAPSMAHSDTAFGDFDQAASSSGRLGQNVVDYYQTAPEAAQGSSVNDVDDDDRDDDDSNEFASFELNWNKRKLKNYSSPNRQTFKTYNYLNDHQRNFANGNAYPVYYAWPSTMTAAAAGVRNSHALLPPAPHTLPRIRR